MTRRFVLLFCLVLSFSLVATISAQDEASEDAPSPTLTPTPEPIQLEPTRVVVEANDGLKLVGDFYVVDPARPTILLLHELYTNRTSWQPLIGLLLGGGYNVLNVDLRGFGETRGSINWNQAIDDVVVWSNWLRTEGGVADAISTLGSSIGSTVALRGCSADPACRTAILISPGWAYYEIGLRVTLEEELGDRAALMIYSQNDRWPALAIPQIEEVASEAVVIEAYPGNAHGMNLLRAEHQTMVPLILDWLAQYGG